MMAGRLGEHLPHLGARHRVTRPLPEIAVAPVVETVIVATDDPLLALIILLVWPGLKQAIKVKAENGRAAIGFDSD